VKIVKLPNGKLRIPLAVSDADGDADGTQTIGPSDPHYAEYSQIALTEQEHATHERTGEIASAELLARWSAHYEAEQSRAS
jgi:hypothetical protein